MSSLLRHIKVLVDALRFEDDGRSELQSLTDSDWRQVLSRWGLIRLTLPLRHICGDQLPAWVRSEIDKNIADNELRFLRIGRVYGEIAAALQHARVEHLVLKGFAQWPSYMQGPGFRAQSDIDLLCAGGSIVQAREALHALGYRSRQNYKPKFEDHLPELQKPHTWQWRGRYFDPESPVPVEVHFRLWNEEATRLRPRGLDQFWLRRETRTVDGFTCPALSDVDSLAYSCLHLLRGLFLSSLLPYHVYELAWFLHTNFDNEDFWRRRRELHDPSLRALQAVCFRLAREWFGCKLAAELDEEIRSLPHGVRRWFDQHSDSPLEAMVRPNKDVLWLHLSLLTSAADKRAILQKRFFPAPMRPAESLERWTPLTLTKFAVRALSRVPHHSRPLPRMLWQGILRFSTRRFSH